jgi:hypothetical protein
MEIATTAGQSMPDTCVTNLGVSVIICTYTDDRLADLTAAVESIRAQSIPPIEVIVVVDHNPRLFEHARACFPDAVVIENQETPGLSGARNCGIATARGAIIAFLDDDAVAATDWLEQLLPGYNDPQIGGVGGAIDPLWSSCAPAWFPEEFNWIVGCTYRGMPEHTTLVRNLIGANMSFRREVFETVGVFRNGIGRLGTQPLGCEETEICIRAHQRWPHRVFLFEPQARVQHRVPAQRTRWAYFRARCYAEGLSKAQIAEFVGTKDGLQSERTYVSRALPRGVVRGVADTMRGDATGLGRAAAIVAGLALTCAGYLVGKVSRRIALGSRTAAPEVPSVPLPSAAPIGNGSDAAPSRKSV